MYTTLIYSVTFCLSLIFCNIYEKTKEKNNKIKNILLILAIVFPPIFLATVRYNVGTDYVGYILNFEQINRNFQLSTLITYYSREPLYVLFCRISYIVFGKSEIWMFMTFACIYMFFIMKAISNFKDKISITFSLLIFYLTYYVVFLNSLRQMVAAAIILYAFKYIFEKKPVKYVLWVIVAGMFHKTAYLMVLLYLLNYKFDSKKVNKIFYSLIIISPLFMLPLQKIIFYLSDKFMIYQKYTNQIASFDLKFLLYVLPIIFLVVIKRKKILELDKRYEILIRILFLQIPFQFLGCFISVADRLAIYCAMFQILLIPIILKTDMTVNEEEIKTLENNKFLIKVSEKKKEIIIKGFTKIQKLLNNKKVLTIGIIAWYILYFVVMYAVLKGQGVYPYQSIFSIK